MKIPSIDFSVQEPLKPSFYYIFHSPLNKVYKIFANPTLFGKIFFQDKATIRLSKSFSSPNLNNNNSDINNSPTFQNPKNFELDFVGTEFSFNYDGKSEYKFIVENVIILPYYKSFTHKNLSSSKILHTFSFLWDSADKRTIFHFTGEPNDSKNSLLNSIMENINNMCQNVDNYLMKSEKNLEENESIKINCSIDDAWSFVTEINNQKLFYPQHKIDVFAKENNLLEVHDYDQKLVITFRISKKNQSDDTRYFITELVNSSPLLPEQKMEVILVKLNEKQTFLIFKHIIFEYIPYDTLMSYSPVKKNAIKMIKKILEEKYNNNNIDKEKEEKIIKDNKEKSIDNK